jgi:hypothetical protein
MPRIEESHFEPILMNIAARQIFASSVIIEMKQSMSVGCR